MLNRVSVKPGFLQSEFRRNWDRRADIAELTNASDLDQLERVATTDPWRDVRMAALEKINDQSALARVVNTTKDLEVVKIAFNKITDVLVLTRLAAEASDKAGIPEGARQDGRGGCGRFIGSAREREDL